MKLKIKLPLAAVLSGLVIFGMFISTLIILKTVESDTEVVSLAGRQRMLSQKIYKDVLLCISESESGGVRSKTKENMQNAIRVFDETLEGLINGGPIPLSLEVDGKKIVAPQAHPDEVKKLQRVNVIWTELSTLLEKIVSGRFKNNVSIKEIDPLFEKLLLTSNESVHELQRESKTHVGTLKMIQFIGVVLGVLCTLFTFFIVIQLLKKLERANTVLQKYSEGDLTEPIRIDVVDEIDETLNKVGKLGENMTSLISEIHAANNILISVTDDFTLQFSEISDRAERMKGSSIQVAGATEQASVRVRSISGDVGNASNSVNTVALSIEEMSSAIGEVAQNCRDEAELAQLANDKIVESLRIMDNLDTSGEEIGRVVSVINDIADQINLLALNATIEAASAGDAGKGFAVVASEVKNLADQTSNSTGLIKKQIEEMQEYTKESHSAIADVVKVVEKVHDISNSIVLSMSEQSQVVNEISGNLGNVNSSSQKISEGAAETASGVEEVSHSMGDVQIEIGEIVSNLGESQKKANELQLLAGELTKLVNVFKIETALIKWEDSLSVGVDEFDSDHQVLIGMINDLNLAMSEGKSKDALGKIIDGLLDYTEYHFGNEERNFKKYDFPDAESHTALHKVFVDKIATFRDDVASGRAMVSKDIMVFLKEWLIKHIMGVDRQYTKFFNERGIL
ncbi:MAG: bacteriohemerythrin [Fibrobacterales bacterium]